MNKIPMLEKFAAQSLVESDGELIFSKEKFAELIVQECAEVIFETPVEYNEIDIMHIIRDRVKEHFGVEP